VIKNNMTTVKNSVIVPQGAWHEEKDVELYFPEKWELTVCHMNGYNAAKLDKAGIRRAFDNPINSKPVRELAKGKKNVVILFDDISRPTKTSEIVPFILEELAEAGVDKDNIQFICALGSHGALGIQEFIKKLGKDIPGQYNVYNHNPYENCSYVGTTSRGTRVSLNTEFMNADLKIGIGAILPHQGVGFGGGGKIILPGIASIDTIVYNHGPVRNQARETGIDANTGMGNYQHNAQRLDIEEACRLSGLDIKIDVIVNEHRDTIALFAGEPGSQYYEGVKLALPHYWSPLPDKPDIVVVNCNAKANETLIGSVVAQSLLPSSGGTVVMVSDNPIGEVCHYLRRKFGNHLAGRLWREPALSKKVNSFILLSPYKDKAAEGWLAPDGAITWVNTWEQVLAVLNDEYPGKARVAVVPDGTIQYFDVVSTLAYSGEGLKDEKRRQSS
jgi:lactate racemase